MVSGGSTRLIGRVFVGSYDSNRRPMGRSGRIVFDLNFHAPESLPVPPL